MLEKIGVESLDELINKRMGGRKIGFNANQCVKEEKYEEAFKVLNETTIFETICSATLVCIVA